MAWLSGHIATLQAVGGLWVGLGVVSLLFTIVALPLMVLRLPSDYFLRHKRIPVSRSSLHPVLAVLASTFKNVLGVVLIVFGLVMIFVPGQGLLTILIGLLLTNFPGKYQLERKLVERPAVLRTLNRIRRRAGREPLLSPEGEVQ